MEVTPVDATFRSPPRLEAGTPPIAAAVGLSAALGWMQSLDWRAARDRERRLRRVCSTGWCRLQACGYWARWIRRIGVAWSPSRSKASLPKMSAVGSMARGRAARRPSLRAFGVEGAAWASLAPYAVDADITALLDGLGEFASTKAVRARRANEPIDLAAR